VDVDKVDDENDEDRFTMGDEFFGIARATINNADKMNPLRDSHGRHSKVDKAEHVVKAAIKKKISKKEKMKDISTKTFPSFLIIKPKNFMSLRVVIDRNTASIKKRSIDPQSLSDICEGADDGIEKTRNAKMLLPISEMI
jgi:hypothetical protein